MTKPGVLKFTLDACAKSHPGNDCKIAIDGKKIAYGFGKLLGDEDLCGHEDAPTLTERKQRLENEQQEVSGIGKLVGEQMLATQDISELDDTHSAAIKSKLLTTITILSNHVKELRIEVTKKKKSSHFTA